MFAQLTSAVHYLHQKKIIHRDLKLENLLLDRHRNIIITDFGFANNFSASPHDLMDTRCGSPCYAAPEVVVQDGRYHGANVDVWSCGVILYAMLAGYLPFDDDPDNHESEDVNKLYRYILDTPLHFPDYVPPTAKDLLKRILVPDPTQRITMQQMMEHPWLTKYRPLFGFSVHDLERAASEQQVRKRKVYREQMQLQQRLLQPLPTSTSDSKPSRTEEPPPSSQPTRPTRSETLPAISQLTAQRKSSPEVPQPIVTHALDPPAPTLAKNIPALAPVPHQPMPAPLAPSPVEFTNESIAAPEVGRTPSGLTVPFTPSPPVPANGVGDPATSSPTAGSPPHPLISPSDKATGTSMKATDFSAKAMDFEPNATASVAVKGKGKMKAQDIDSVNQEPTPIPPSTSAIGPRVCLPETSPFQQSETSPEHSAPRAEPPVDSAAPAPAPQSSEPTLRKSSVTFATLPASAQPTTEAPQTNGSQSLDVPKAHLTPAPQPYRSHSRSTSAGAIPDQQRALSPLKDNWDSQSKSVGSRFSLLTRGLTKRRPSSSNEATQARPPNLASSKGSSPPSVQRTRPASQSALLVCPPNGPEAS